MVATMARDVRGRGILPCFRDAVRPDRNLLITDAYPAYRKETQESYLLPCSTTVRLTPIVLFIRIPLKASGLYANGPGMVAIITIVSNGDYNL